MPAATLPAPEPLPAADRCGNCRRLVDGLLRGRCKTCHDYWRKHRKERPAHLRAKRAVTWKRLEPWLNAEGRIVGPWCECGRLAVWRVTVPISERARARLLLCEACAAVERGE
jgi:hypothetical protein